MRKAPFYEGLRCGEIRASHILPLLPAKRVGGAVIEVRRIRLTAATSLPVIIHFRATVRAEHQPGQGIGFAKGVDPARSSPQLLNKFPGALVHDSLMGILKNQPVLWGMKNWLLILIGFFVGTKVDRMAHVLRFRQYPSHNEVAPSVGTVNIFFAFPRAAPLLCQVSRRGFNLVPIQNVCNIAQAVPLNGQLIDAPHNCRRFLVNQPMILVAGVFL